MLSACGLRKNKSCSIPTQPTARVPPPPHPHQNNYDDRTSHTADCGSPWLHFGVVPCMMAVAVAVTWCALSCYALALSQVMRPLCLDIFHPLGHASHPSRAPYRRLQISLRSAVHVTEGHSRCPQRQRHLLLGIVPTGEACQPPRSTADWTHRRGC